MGLVQTVPAASEPLVFADVSAFLRVGSDETALVTTLIKAVRGYVESYLEQSLLTQTWKLTLDDGFAHRSRRSHPSEFYLPRGPVQSVTSVKYIDIDEVEQTLVAGTDYEVNLSVTPPAIRPKSGKAWPSTNPQYGAVEVLYVTGYGDTAAAIPQNILHAMRLYLVDIWENRQSRAMVFDKGITLPPAPLYANYLLDMERTFGLIL